MRHFSFRIVAVALVATAVLGIVWSPLRWSLAISIPLLMLGCYDTFQTKHAIWRTYPIVGRLRMVLEGQRGPIRQYFIEGDTDGRPFGREQRSLVYARAKREIDTTPFGTKLDVYAPGAEWISHSLAPKSPRHPAPRVRIGGSRCTQPYVASYLNVSAMSFGALSATAVRALSNGAHIGGFAVNTGEGGLSPYHLEGGSDLIWQIGTGYFGCRLPDGRFDQDAFARRAQHPNVRMIELKLSQGAKPAHGGILPGKKVTLEIAEIRGIESGIDCISPAAHSTFRNPRELLVFLDYLRSLSGGKPVGMKLCVGDWTDFFGIAKAIRETGLAPDFITVDGGEGGTGAAPLELTNSAGAPLSDGLVFVHNVLVGFGIRDDIRIIASGRIISGFDIAKRIAMGADLVAAARGFMFALGCIQALECNRNTCPVGVATQDPALTRGLVVAEKQQRVANFHELIVHSLLELVGVAGFDDPRDLRPWHIQRRISQTDVRSLAGTYRYLEPNALLDGFVPPEYEWPMRLSSPDAFGPTSRAVASEHA